MPALRNLEPTLGRVQKPARYTGGEWNSIVKDWDACDVRVALAYPDLYDIGMSNLGLGILYDIVNRRDGMLAERVFAPWSDMEAIMRAEGVPLWCLETRHPLARVRHPRLLAELRGHLHQHPQHARPRRAARAARRSATDAHPLIICGGSGALNPDALADFVDVFVLGDGEETDRRRRRLRARVEARRARGIARRDAAPPAEDLGHLRPALLRSPTYNADGTIAVDRPDRRLAAAARRRSASCRSCRRR